MEADPKTDRHHVGKDMFSTMCYSHTLTL